MERRLDITTAALMDCDICGREVEAVHADCDTCYEQAPEQASLIRCAHFICRRCDSEI